MNTGSTPARSGAELAAAALAAAMAGAAHAAGEPATLAVRHAQGETTVPANPAKTVVMDLAALDTLHALGVDVAGVPDAKLPAHLAQYQDSRYVKVGSLFEPNYEVIHALAPQLIVAGGRSAAKYRELSRLAPTLDLTVDPKDLPGSVARNTETLGRIFGKQDEAARALQELQASIAALKAKAEKAGTGLIVLTTGGKMSAYGPGSRFGVIHDSFGIAPAAVRLDTSNHGQAISFEFILQADPDWLFVIDRDAAIGREGLSAQRLLDNELVRQTKAWKNGRVVYLNALNWYLLGNAGLTAMRENVRQIDQALDAAQ